MISGYSIAAGIAWFTLVLVFIAALQKRTGFMLRASAQLLLFAAALALVRMLLPLDFRQAYVIQSFHIYPAIMAFLRSPLFGWLKVWQVFLLVWALGSAVVLGYEIWALLAASRRRKCYRRIPSQQAEQAAKRAGLLPGDIVVSSDVAVPMAAGLFRPKMYLPLLTLTDEELDWIVRHETQHIKGKDVWLKLLYTLLQAALWWNPFVWYFARELDSILELRCDQAVLRGRSEGERHAYVQTLLQVTTQLCAGRRHYPASAVTFARPVKKSALTRRAELILHTPPRHRRQTIAAGLLCLVLFAASYFVILQPAGAPPEEDLAGEVIFSEDDTYFLVHKEDGSYELWCNGDYFASLEGYFLNEEPFCNMNIIEEQRK